MSTYECPVHKTVHAGTKRDDFSQQVHNALLEVDMMTSMRIYKEINQSCHCPKNYTAFDALWRDVNGPKSIKGSVEEGK